MSQEILSLGNFVAATEFTRKYCRWETEFTRRYCRHWEKLSLGGFGLEITGRPALEV